jgi:hypothetical protein
MMAEEDKEWVRGAIKAGAGVTLEERARAADAARDKYLKSMERLLPASAPAEPAATPASEPDVRIRRL